MNKLNICIFMLLCLVACRNNEGQVFEFCPEAFTIEDNQLIGERLGEVLQADLPILDKMAYAPAYEYVNRLLSSLVKTPQVLYRNELNWEVNIIEDDGMQTAYFLPDGQFYIYTGLLKFLKSEHQLLTIMSHELFYANNDIILNSIYNEDSDECFSLGDILLDKEDIEDLQVFADRLPDLSYSGNYVTEADSFSVEVLCNFRYDPLGIQDIISLVELNSDTIRWLENRAMGDFQLRIDYNISKAIDCNLGGVRNEAIYQDFVKDDLP